MDASALLEGLDPAQRDAVTTDAAPLCVLAGAGSGKTRVLTRRIAYRVARGVADAGHVLALTFTRKAAGELARRLADLGVRGRVATGTFHAVAYAQLRRRWADRGEPEPSLLERKVPLLAPLLRPVGDATVQPADLAAEIEWAKARLVGPGRYEAEVAATGRRPPLPAATVADLYERYERQKRRRRLVDFDDLLLACVLALETDAEFAAAQRWRFRHLFVDEFQDVNPAQFRLLEAWRGGRADLCVVGDPHQAIYGWNGADASYLTAFRRRFPGAGIVRLDHNYRSSPQVVAVAGAVLAAGPAPARPVQAHRPDGPVPMVTAYATDKEEAAGIARSVRDHHGPRTPWSHLAVLVRTNAQAVPLEEAFRAAGIPYRVRGAGAFLDQPEVRQVLAELRRAPPRVALASQLDDVAALAAEAGRGSVERRLELEALVRLGREYAALDPSGSAHGFVAWLKATFAPGDADRIGATAAGGSPDSRVEIATFHRAKGLEWPVVFVAGLERGLVPIGHAEGPEALAEERRLLYVALSRAERELQCSWAERRTFGSRTLARGPSPYLDAVDAARAALAGGGPVDWRRFLDDGRGRLRAADDRQGAVVVGRGADPEVLAALKRWRAATARLSGVPPSLILHDTTLAAVAEAQPASHDALLAVPGLGPLKVERYGDGLLALVARHGAQPATA